MPVILYVLIALALVGGGGYYMLNQAETDSATSVETTSGNSTVTNDEEKEMEEVDDNFSGIGSFAALLALGRSITCDFSYTDDEFNGTSEGTVYIDGDRIRGDFILTTPEGEMESHVINDGNKGYTWGSTPMGDMALMFEVTEDHAADNSVRNDDNPFESDEDVEYSCKPWRVDGSKFVPPSDIQFMDFTSGMNELNANIESMEAIQCSACDNIPDAAAKAQCQAALGCS